MSIKRYTKDISMCTQCPNVSVRQIAGASYNPVYCTKLDTKLPFTRHSISKFYTSNAAGYIHPECPLPDVLQQDLHTLTIPIDHYLQALNLSLKECPLCNKSVSIQYRYLYTYTELETQYLGIACSSCGCTINKETEGEATKDHYKIAYDLANTWNSRSNK